MKDLATLDLSKKSLARFDQNSRSYEQNKISKFSYFFGQNFFMIFGLGKTKDREWKDREWKDREWKGGIRGVKRIDKINHELKPGGLSREHSFSYYESSIGSTN